MSTKDRKFYLHGSRAQQSIIYDTVKNHIVQHVQKSYKKNGIDIANSLENEDIKDLMSLRPVRQVSAETDATAKKIEQDRFNIEYCVLIYLAMIQINQLNYFPVKGTIILPWGKYEYQRLPMGLCTSPNIFQEKMGILMQDLKYVRAYIDDLLILTKSSFTDHLEKLEEVFK